MQYESEEFNRTFELCKKYLERTNHLCDADYGDFEVEGVTNDQFMDMIDVIHDNNVVEEDAACPFSNAIVVYRGVTFRMMWGQGTAYNAWIESPDKYVASNI